MVSCFPIYTMCSSDAVHVMLVQVDAAAQALAMVLKPAEV
jgi:hypothetical protein